MTKTFDLTPNETQAALVLVEVCFQGMGGKRPSDLEHDEFTWVAPEDLIGKGWTRHEAAGTWGSLMDKGLIFEYDKNEFYLGTDAWKFLDTLWDNR